MKMAKSIVCIYYILTIIYYTNLTYINENKSSLAQVLYLNYLLFKHKPFVGDFNKVWYRHVTLSKESASEIEHQHNIQNKNKRFYGQSSVMIHEDSDTSSEEGNLLIHFFYNSLLLFFLTIVINVVQQKKKIKVHKLV